MYSPLTCPLACFHKKPHSSPRHPARTLERVNLHRLDALPIGVEIGVDPAAIACTAGEAVDLGGAHTDFVHDGTRRWDHAWKEVDTRAPEGGVELESDEGGCVSPVIPYLLFVFCERVGRL